MFSALLPPKLAASADVITETDSVTLNCQAPSFVSVLNCYFYPVKTNVSRTFSCMETLTGTKLLELSEQTSPAEVEMKCFYTVQYGDLKSPSPHSHIYSITIRSESLCYTFYWISSCHVRYFSAEASRVLMMSNAI